MKFNIFKFFIYLWILHFIIFLIHSLACYHVLILYFPLTQYQLISESHWEVNKKTSASPSNSRVFFGNYSPWEWTGDREQVHYGHRQQNHICWSPHVFLTEYNDDKWVADHGDNKVHWDNVSVDENCQIQWPAPFRCIDVVTRLVIEARTQRTDLEEGKKRNPFVL